MRRYSAGQLGQLAALLVGRKLQDGVGVPIAPVQSLFRDAIEEGVKLIELPLLDGVVLVIVAARAPHGHPHPNRGRGLDAIDHVLVEVLLRDSSPFVVDHVIAVETRCDLLFKPGAGQEIAGQLLGREPVKRQVAVESINDPLAPVPHVAVAVDVVSVSIGVTGEIEPLQSHPLAVARRAEKPVHYLFERVRRPVR